MRILYIHQYFKTREGSSSTRSYEFAKRFVDSGHEVTILTGDSRMTSKDIPISKGIFSNQYLIDGIHVIAIKNSYSNYMSNIRRIFSFFSFLILASIKGIFTRKYDIVYATSTPLTVGVPALIMKLIKRTPFVFEVRDLWPEAPIQMGAIKSKPLIHILKILERSIYRHAEHVVALSPGMKEGVIKENTPKTKISMIPNSCDLDLFNNSKVPEIDFRDKYNLQDDFVVIHPGSMGKANGLQYILEAAFELKRMGNNTVKILLTGDGQTRPLLEKYCKDNELENVIFTGNVAKKKMPDLLGATDITITSFANIPILATNSPNKFFDSLAAGKPIIVNSNGWTKDIVNNHQVGFYVDPENPSELANLLDALSKDHSELKGMGLRSRRLAESKFDRNKLAKELETVLINSAKK